ncbi:MAG TPA: hypothetical protein VF555_00500 [Variovorax sp.]
MAITALAATIGAQADKASQATALIAAASASATAAKQEHRKHQCRNASSGKHSYGIFLRLKGIRHRTRRVLRFRDLPTTASGLWLFSRRDPLSKMTRCAMARRCLQGKMPSTTSRNEMQPLIFHGNDDEPHLQAPRGKP